MSKLIEGSSDISASDIAETICKAVAHKQFLVLTHPKAQQAYDLKLDNLEQHLASMEPLAQQVLQRAKRTENS